MNEPPITFGILGSGNMARVYGDALATQVPDGRLTAIALGTRATPLAAEFGVDAEPSTEALVARDDVDVVVIATPHSTHLPLALAAAAAGKHVYLEKPMALDVAECDQIIDACRANGVQLTIAKQTRHMEMSMRAKAFIDEGRIGRILFLRPMSVTPGRRLRERPPELAVRPARGRRLPRLGRPRLRRDPLVHRRRRGPRLRRLRQLHRPAAREPDRDGPGAA